MAQKSLRLDRSPSAEPLWRQVAALLELDVSQAHEGDRLPSEGALTERYGVSRVTLRQALRTLEGDGRIRSRPGLGWFVTGGQFVAEPPGLLQSFSTMARSRGYEPSATVLEAQVRRAKWDESAALQVPAGSGIFALRRLRLMDGNPVAIDESRIPEMYLREAAQIDWSTQSLYESFALSGLKPVRADFEVRADAATEEQAELLEVPPGFPVLTASQTTFDVDDRPIELGHIIYRSDRYSFRAALTV